MSDNQYVRNVSEHYLTLFAKFIAPSSTFESTVKYLQGPLRKPGSFGHVAYVTITSVCTNCYVIRVVTM